MQEFLTSAERAAHRLPPQGQALAARIFAALRTAPPVSNAADTARIPACRHLAPALEFAQRQPGPVGALATEFAAIEPTLHWQMRAGAEAGDPTFRDGHANAVLVGQQGRLRHDEVYIGVSLVAPRTEYPRHHHRPEEFYIAMSEGEWRQNDGDWFAPGVGGIVYNTSDIWHAMRALERPLLAVWFLWVGA